MLCELKAFLGEQGAPKSTLETRDINALVPITTSEGQICAEVRGCEMFSGQ